MRLDRDAADGVQNAQERLTSELRSSIREPDRLAEPRRATLGRSSKFEQVVHRAIAGVQSAIDEDDKIEKCEIAGKASSVSAGDATANPRSRVALGGTLWRTTCSPRRRGRGSSRETAMKKGGSAGILGSHHPRNAAALRWVITADLGRTNCQAAAREASGPAAGSGR